MTGGRIASLGFATWAMMATASFARADPVADFYRGRTISLLIGSGEGGGFDASARLAAQFLPKFIPGSPSFAAQNMPGASGLRVAEIIANVAPRDGLTIGMTQPAMALNKAMDPSLRFDPRHYSWIGRVGSFTTFGVIATNAPIKTVADARTTAAILSASGPTGPGAMLPEALNRMIGTRFTTVKGYKSAQDSGLALDRGEVQGIGSASMEFIESKGWISRGVARVFFTIGFDRDPRAPDAPTSVELMESDRDRAAMKLIVSPSAIGRALIAPPGIPPERLQALRAAFDAMVRDPEVLAEAKKRGVEVEPIAGAAMQNMIDDVLTMPPEVIERARAVTAITP
jgi:tripartite-type tricarboxylate transporter receptor subunit TctC